MDFRKGACDMWMFVLISLGTIHIVQCSDIDFMNRYDFDKYEETDTFSEEVLDISSDEPTDKSNEDITTQTTNTESPSITTEPKVNRRYWLVSSKLDIPKDQPYENDNNDKDSNLKSKITTLVEQTLHDTERKLRSLQRLKEKHKNEAPYKIGFILSLVKKSKDVLNELFNVAVKHRDDYKALEQLKIFELIVHTNVDTTNLVRQMVEIHIQHVNATSPLHTRNRVVLL